MQHQEVSLVRGGKLRRGRCHLLSQISWCYKHAWMMEVTCPNPYDLKATYMAIICMITPLIRSIKPLH